MTAPLLIAGAAGSGTVVFTPTAVEATLVPADVVSVATYPYMPGSRAGVVKLHAPVLFAVAVPSLVPEVLHTVTVEPPAAVPVSVREYGIDRDFADDRSGDIRIC